MDQEARVEVAVDEGAMPTSILEVSGSIHALLSPLITQCQYPPLISSHFLALLAMPLTTLALEPTQSAFKALVLT